VNIVTAEKFIHVTVFFLLLFGLCIISGWASFTFVANIALKVAAIMLSWGVILLVLHVVFGKLGWQWWS